MFQLRGLGAIDIDRPGLNPGSGVPQPPQPWGGSGGGGAPPYFGFRMPVLTRSHNLTPLAPSRVDQPPACPPGFAWGMQKNGQTGCFPTDNPVDMQNPTPGTTVEVGAEPGSPAYDAMVTPWWQRPIVIFGGLALAVGIGVFISRKF